MKWKGINKTGCRDPKPWNMAHYYTLGKPKDNPKFTLYVVRLTKGQKVEDGAKGKGCS